MAKRSGMYKFEKRSKEIKRKKKQEAKIQKRLNKDETSGGGPEIDYTLCTTAAAAGVDLAHLIEQQEKAAAEAAAKAQEAQESEDAEEPGE
jgi:hypothetical protein